MPIIVHTERFDKNFWKLKVKFQQKASLRIDLFIEDPFDSVLNNHPLHGEYEGYRSINVTGDLRIIYEEIGEARYVFHDIGTHGQLYE